MKKTVYWTNTEIHNYSAEVDIPDDVASEGENAILDYVRNNETLIAEISNPDNVDDIDIIESFDGLTVESE